MQIKKLAGIAMIIGSVAGSSMMAVGTTAVAGAAGYTMLAVASTSMGVADAEARRSSSSRSSFSSSSSRSSYSAPAPARSATTPAVSNSSRGKPAAAPAPAATAPAASSSMIGSKTATPATTRALPARTTPARYSSTPPVNRTWNSSPAQRASNGSMVAPILMGAAAGIGGSMLYNWITAPSVSTTSTTDTASSSAQTTAATTQEAGATGSAGSNLQIVKPSVDFKKFEGSQIPAEYQEAMKKQGVTVEPKQGEITEYSKKIKTKSGIEVTIDVAELPVLVVYMNEAGKPTEALFMPI